MKVLIVVDMQNDFIDGALGSPEAVAIVEKVRKKVESFEGEVIFTQDTHYEEYLSTQEGKKLPVLHCIKDTKGWKICDELETLAENRITKETFGCLVLPEYILDCFGEEPEEIQLVGLCTDICVISNAMIVKTAFPEIPVIVDSACCAGVTPESHENALSAMKAVQIEII